ncbi:hypothetical protein ACFQH6_14200 [Halobacteriaceae archaeon GCM10025711]
MSATATARDLDETFRQVVAAVRAWEPDTATTLPIATDLQSHLDRSLADAERHEVRAHPGGESVDVSVDGTIAVAVFREFNAGTVGEFQNVVGAISQRFDYLVIYGFDLPAKDLDRWRMGKLKYTADRSNVRDIAYVRRSEGVEETTSSWPSGLWRFAEATVAVLAVLIGIEIGFLLELWFGGTAPC